MSKSKTKNTHAPWHIALQSVGGPTLIPAATQFVLPEGVYRATLIRVQPVAGKLRLLFDITHWRDAIMPDSPPTAYLAGRNFVADLSRTSQLRRALELWRKVSATDLTMTDPFGTCDALIGQDGDLQLVHFYRRRNEPPFVNIDAIYPVGTYLPANLNESAPISLNN